MKNKLYSKFSILQYLEFTKDYKKVKDTWKYFLDYKVSNQKDEDIIPLPNLKYYHKTIGKFILAEPERCDVIKAFLDAKIKIISEKFQPSKISNNEIILVCMIKNDINKINEFIEYYRNIGIKYFVFLDNNSTDGTYEFLINQKDINLYSVTQEYSTMNREGWMNRIYSYYGFEKWFLCIDSDELFTYIGQEENNIYQFVNKIKHKTKRVKALMLDMYSEKNLFEETEQISFEKTYPYFDPNSYEITDFYKSNVISGGPRKRIFSLKNEKFKCALSKYPLFFYERGDFQGCSHWSFPFYKNKNNIFAILRHYKFTIDDMEKYKERVIKGNYAAGSAEYKTYLNIIEKNEKISFFYNNSKKFNNSYDLLTIDLNNRKIENVFNQKS